LIDKVYGKVIQTYNGRGKLELHDRNELPCHITVQQIETGAIYIACKIAARMAQASSIVQSIMAIMNFSAQEVEHVYGKTKDGISFKSKGKLYTIHANLALFSNKSSELRLLAEEVEFGLEDKGRAKYYEFSVVNFEFIGNHMLEKTLRKDGRENKYVYLGLKLETPWGVAEIYPMADYDNVVSKVKAQKDISVTCTLLAKPTARMELKSVIAKVDELCKLLSLARGTKINWINARSYTRTNQLCHTILKNSIAWPFSHHPLIDPRNPNDTPFFIKKIYPAYMKHRDSHNLDIAIEQYLDARRETAYLETRGLAAVALIDSLQQLYASGHGLTEIVEEFRKRERRVQEGLKKLMMSIFPEIQNPELDEMLQKTQELNRRSFLKLLKKWTNDLGLNIPATELSLVRDTRNSLAHKLRFISTDNRGKIQEYYRLLNIIDQVFLKLLGYQGYYINVNLSTLAFERKELESSY
jgi:hypothetical protein